MRSPNSPLHALLNRIMSVVTNKLPIYRILTKKIALFTDRYRLGGAMHRP